MEKSTENFQWGLLSSDEFNDVCRQALKVIATADAETMAKIVELLEQRKREAGEI